MLNFIQPLSFLSERIWDSGAALYQNFLVLFKVMAFLDTKGNSLFGYYLCLFAVVLLFKFLFVY